MQLTCFPDKVTGFLFQLCTTTY